MSSPESPTSYQESTKSNDESPASCAERPTSNDKSPTSSRESTTSSAETTTTFYEKTMSTTETTMTTAETVMDTLESAMTKKKRPTPAEQDEALANFISQSRVAIETFLAHPELLSKLALRGYDATKLNAGLALQSAAQAAFTARQIAIGNETQANQAVATARTAAHSAHYDFRETVRAAFRGQSERQALGVVGTIPADTERLLTQARASYAAAAQAPYSAVLSGLGYNAAGLSAANATVTTLQTARATQEAARSTAVAATATRNAAAKELREWMQALNRITKIALR